MSPNFAQHLLNKVRADYNHIAGDFANTRTQIWPEMLGLFDYIKKGDRVLDLGCGQGRFVSIIKQKGGPARNASPARQPDSSHGGGHSDAGGQYFGVDVSEKLIEIAKQNYPSENFQINEPLKLPFNNNYFDIIYSIAVLHHIPSKELRLEFLYEAKRVLKSKGFLIITVWRPKDKQEKTVWFKFLLKKIFNLTGGLDFGDVIEPWFGKNKGERYFHCFSKKELAGLIKMVGFEILKCGVIKNEKGNRQNLYIVAQKG